jgi:hypothetical protein
VVGVLDVGFGEFTILEVDFLADRTALTELGVFTVFGVFSTLGVFGSLAFVDLDLTVFLAD